MFFTCLLLVINNGQAKLLTFNDIVKSMSKHVSVKRLQAKSKTQALAAKMQSSWGGPKFKLAAKNFPTKNLRGDITPMSGVEYGLSQKIALSQKYGQLENSTMALSLAEKYKARSYERFLIKYFWEILILQKKVNAEIEIIKDNIDWTGSILKVSKKMYSNGKTSQQAILDIQIRISQLESSLSSKRYELEQLGSKLSYLVADSNSNVEFDFKSVPWNVLEAKKTKATLKDFNHMVLQQKLLSNEYKLSAAKLNFIPDLTVSLGYTTRSDIDGNGDFVSAAVTFPIPSSDLSFKNYKKAVQMKRGAMFELENFKRQKTRDASILAIEINKIKAEILILKNKTIKFANNSRTITAKSYGHGRATYNELFSSEIRLQQILTKLVMLETSRDTNVVALKYILGEALNE